MKFPRASTGIRGLLICAGILSLSSQQGFAETLAYQSVGEFGEPVFSDIQHPTSETIVLPASEAAGLSSDELISQMLTVAQTLEQARLVRQAERKADRETRATYQPTAQQESQPVEVDRYPVFFPYPHRPGHGHRPKPPIESPEPLRKAFRFEPGL